MTMAHVLVGFVGPCAYKLCLLQSPVEVSNADLSHESYEKTMLLGQRKSQNSAQQRIRT